MCICNATWHMQLLTHQTVVAGACGKLLSVDDLIDHSAMPRRVQQTIYAYIQISAQPRGITNLPSFITSFTRSYCVFLYIFSFFFLLMFLLRHFYPTFVLLFCLTFAIEPHLKLNTHPSNITCPAITGACSSLFLTASTCRLWSRFAAFYLS